MCLWAVSNASLNSEKLKIIETPPILERSRCHCSDGEQDVQLSPYMNVY